MLLLRLLWLVLALHLPPVQTTVDGLVGQLKALFELHQAGGLTEAEFSAAKAQLPLGLPV